MIKWKMWFHILDMMMLYHVSAQYGHACTENVEFCIYVALIWLIVNMFSVFHGDLYAYQNDMKFIQ